MAYFRDALRNSLFILSFFIYTQLHSQVLGGNSVFNFLKLPASPQLAALGGINVSQPSDDPGMAFYNPALLDPSMHSRLHAAFNGFYAGAKGYHLSLAYRSEKLQTNFLWGLSFLDYGSITETEAAGNIIGEFRPSDWVMQLSASRKYLDKWNYGAALKFINSNYGRYRSNGVALDVGVLFRDTAKSFSASMLVKNMGTQLKKYDGSTAEDLPFDLEIGLTKRLAHAPFAFSVTAQRLHQFDTRYADTSFNNSNGFPNGKSGFSVGKLLDHIILATTIYIDRIEAIVGYNFLRRRDLNIGTGGNGLNGFSMGAGVSFGKLQLRYARAYYQSNTAYNQFGITMKLNEYFGLGKFGERIGW